MLNMIIPFIQWTFHRLLTQKSYVWIQNYCNRIVLWFKIKQNIDGFSSYSSKSEFITEKSYLSESPQCYLHRTSKILEITHLISFQKPIANVAFCDGCHLFHSQLIFSIKRARLCRRALLFSLLCLLNTAASRNTLGTWRARNSSEHSWDCTDGWVTFLAYRGTGSDWKRA